MFFKQSNLNSINSDELKELLKSTKINLIDVREKYEFAQARIQGSKNVPMMTLVSNPQDNLEKEKKYYIICLSGGRSRGVCKELVKQGYNVVDVSGGLNTYASKHNFKLKR